MGGRGPRSPASSSVFSESASSAVLPLINSVARLATAMAVSQPNDWKVALSITFFPRSSLYLIHIRSISPHSELPTVPTASAFGSSPTFCGFAIASRIRFSKSSFITDFRFTLYDLLVRLHIYAQFVNRKSHIVNSIKTWSKGALDQPVASHALVHFLRPRVNTAAQASY